MYYPKFVAGPRRLWDHSLLRPATRVFLVSREKGGERGGSALYESYLAGWLAGWVSQCLLVYGVSK